MKIIYILLIIICLISCTNLETAKYPGPEYVWMDGYWVGDIYYDGRYVHKVTGKPWKGSRWQYFHGPVYQRSHR